MAEVMRLPFWRVNVLTGIKGARVMADYAECASLIRRAKRPLFVTGPRATEYYIDGVLHLDYCLDIAKAANIPICATGHAKKKMLELGVTPDSVYDIIEIINHLKDPYWQGVRKEGNHDLVVFSGIRCDLAERGLATLKHFAPHLKTMALCRFSHPNADYAQPILSDEKWKVYFDDLVAALKEGVPAS
jgi:acetyl-CoA decarbonylase/synthase complex subunit epsilon